MDDAVCLLESLPQDVLVSATDYPPLFMSNWILFPDVFVANSNLIKIFQIKVLCKVNHSDLRQLLLVSKPVSEAVRFSS
jgi:hypothetical protein